MKKPKIVIISLIFVIIALTGVRVVLANHMSTSGVVLGSVQDELAHYEMQNTMLREQVNTLSSLSHIEKVALKLGFVESKGSIALTRSQPIARR